jgi:Methyltransferase FkbM domain
MNSFLFQIYRILVPKPVRTIFLKRDLRRKILRYYTSFPENESNDEQNEVIKYLENNPVTTFPYPFSHNYSPEKIEVFYDHSCRMKYVFLDGKKLYFKKRWSKQRIRRAYSDLSREQDPESPHRYPSDSFYPGMNDEIADIGAAEGNFSLSVIEKVRKVYLIENDPEWIEALRVTFAPWKEKVSIIGKFVSDTDDEKNIRLDTLMKSGNNITFLKIDVDGFEDKVLNGAMETISSKTPLKIALCTYHKHNDEKDFSLLLKNNGFTVTPSKGYMIHYYDKKIKMPWLRRGLLRAIR